LPAGASQFLQRERKLAHPAVRARLRALV
jgi:hypothetical protein